jgi:hypothetical protein
MGCIASATLQLDSLREKAESLEAKEGAKFGLTSTPFRSLKTVDLELRPVFDWTALRVRAHVLLCIAGEGGEIARRGGSCAPGVVRPPLSRGQALRARCVCGRPCVAPPARAPALATGEVRCASRAAGSGSSEQHRGEAPAHVPLQIIGQHAHIAPQSPTERSSTTLSATPGRALGSHRVPLYSLCHGPVLCVLLHRMRVLETRSEPEPALVSCQSPAQSEPLPEVWVFLTLSGAAATGGRARRAPRREAPMRPVQALPTSKPPPAFRFRSQLAPRHQRGSGPEQHSICTWCPLSVHPR